MDTYRLFIIKHGGGKGEFARGISFSINGYLIVLLSLRGKNIIQICHTCIMYVGLTI